MAEPIDLRGVSCPSNYVHARLALEAVAEGDEIEMLLDAGEPVRNVPRSLKLDGDKVLALDAEGGHYRMRVQKGSGPGAW